MGWAGGGGSRSGGVVEAVEWGEGVPVEELVAAIKEAVAGEAGSDQSTTGSYWA